MNKRVEFGPFVLDLERRELRKAGEPMSLSPKAYELLEALVISRPKAQSKLALQERLWPDTFVIDKNLTNLVADLRRALGDDSAKPRFVRTVHRYGYAFQDPAPLPATHAGDARFRLLWPEGHAGLRDGEHVLGRDPDLALFFDSPTVSRRHALIRIDGDDATVEDLGSKNGTFVGERRLDASTPLTDGDVLRLGEIALTFKVIQTHGSTCTEPRAKR